MRWQIDLWDGIEKARPFSSKQRERKKKIQFQHQYKIDIYVCLLNNAKATVIIAMYGTSKLAASASRVAVTIHTSVRGRHQADAAERNAHAQHQHILHMPMSNAPTSYTKTTSDKPSHLSQFTHLFEQFTTAVLGCCSCCKSTSLHSLIPWTSIKFNHPAPI